jgi:hypothetical protein
LTGGNPALADDQSNPPLSSAKARRLAAKKAMSIRELAALWAVELGDAVSEPGKDVAAEFAREIAEFKLAWPEDQPTSPAVLLWDPPSPSPMLLADYLEKIVRQARVEQIRPDRPIWKHVSNNMLMISREDVWIFCDVTGLAPPSWWPRPPVQSSAPPASSSATINDDSVVAKLTEFLNALSSPTKESRARELARDHLGAFTDRQWRQARRCMQSTKKLRRGNPK